MEKFDSNFIDSKIIDDVMKLIGENRMEIDTPIKAFNLFLSSNTDYLYNKTYILDWLDKFNKNINILQEIYIKTQNLFNDLMEALKPVDKYWFVLIDDYFIITSCYTKGILTYYRVKNDLEHELLDIESLEYIDKKINKYINCTNLFNVNEKEHTIRLFVNDFNTLFSFNFKNNIQLIEQIKFFIQGK